MPEQSCRTCDYYSPEYDPVRIGTGWCRWASRNPVPSCFSQCECETWDGDGAICPCWRVKGYIEKFLAEARARRNEGNRV